MINGTEEWLTEPARVEFVHAGLSCLIRRASHGALCGYVAVPPGHPLHGKAAHAVDLDAHGTVNYAAPCGGEVCHVPQPGEPDDVWWFGFDCAHVGRDYVPLFAQLYGGSFADGIYRNMEYVRGEVEDLAEQLRDAGQP